MSDKGPFMATWTDEINPHQESLPAEQSEATEQPVDMPADGFYWLSYDSPSDWAGNPVQVIGEFFYLPGNTHRYSVRKIIEQKNGKFTPIEVPA